MLKLHFGKRRGAQKAPKSEHDNDVRQLLHFVVYLASSNEKRRRNRKINHMILKPCPHLCC
jgi:hypothetical protein